MKVLIVWALALSVSACNLNPFAPDPVQTEAKVQATTGWRGMFDGREIAGAAGSQTISLGVSRDDKCATVAPSRPGSVSLQVGSNRGSTTDVDRPVTVCGKGLIR